MSYDIRQMIQVLTIGLFCIACVFALSSSKWALALAVTMFTFEQALQAASPIFIERSTLCNLIVATVIGLSIVREMFSNKTIFLGFIDPSIVCTFIIYFWSALTLSWTPANAAFEIVVWGIPYFLLFLCAAPFLLIDIESAGSFMRSILYLGVLVLVVLIINPEFTFMSGRLGIQLSGVSRSNPLAIGELGGTLIIVASLLRIGPTQWLLNLARLVAFGLGALISLQSGSRGQLAFAVILAVLFFPVSKQIKSFKNFIGTIVGVGVIFPAIYFLATKFMYTDVLNRWNAEDLAGGTGVRILNIIDLLLAWVQSPFAWFVGLGFNAFSAVTSAGSREGYSHNMSIDILTELGIPMFVLYLVIIYISIRHSLWLFQRFKEQPLERASISVLLALFVYQLLLVNKQANLWGNQMFFFYVILLARLHKRTVVSDEIGNANSASNLNFQIHSQEPDGNTHPDTEESPRNNLPTGTSSAV